MGIVAISRSGCHGVLVAGFLYRELNQKALVYEILSPCHVYAGDCMPKIPKSSDQSNIVSYSKAIPICPDILTLKILHILNVISDMSDSGMILFDYTFYQLSGNI